MASTRWTVRDGRVTRIGDGQDKMGRSGDGGRVGNGAKRPRGGADGADGAKGPWGGMAMKRNVVGRAGMGRNGDRRSGDGGKWGWGEVGMVLAIQVKWQCGRSDRQRIQNLWHFFLKDRLLRSKQ